MRQELRSPRFPLESARPYGSSNRSPLERKKPRKTRERHALVCRKFRDEAHNQQANHSQRNSFHRHTAGRSGPRSARDEPPFWLRAHFSKFSKISAALQPRSLERHHTHTRRKRGGTPARAARIPLKTKFHFPPSALRRNGRPERYASPLSFDRRYLARAPPLWAAFRAGDQECAGRAKRGRNGSRYIYIQKG